MENKPYFYDLDREELKDLLLAMGEPAYRAGQVWSGIYAHSLAGPQEITSLSKPLRDRLQQKIQFSRLEPIERKVSSDKETVKTLFRLPGNALVEAVLMHYDERETLCISSQSGCAMNCVFCATGQMGFTRNLSQGEITEQVMYYAQELARSKRKVTNVVIMGMGEPLQNYESVMGAIRRLNDVDGANLGARRFTISTVGILPQIQRFAAEKSQVNLAVSLHAANDPLRNFLIPVNRKYPLAALISTCKEYVDLTGRRITFEWALINGVNDSLKDAEELAALVKGMLCHVNLIPLNPTVIYPGNATTVRRAQEFRHVLDAHGIPCTIRLPRGIDIQAGCGQLAARHS